jgi:hypothetical protein
MNAVEKGQDSEQHRAAMLAAMGVQVWYKRRQPNPQPPATQTDPRLEQQIQPQVEVPQPARVDEAQEQASSTPTVAPELIEFGWVKSSSGIIVCPLPIDQATAVLLKDVLIYGDWLRGQIKTKVSRGEFRWPQLLDTTEGSPVRALTVFFAKHLSADKPWIGITPEVAPTLTKWLTQLPYTVVELPSLQHNIGDVTTKKTIWSVLKHND